MRIKLSSCYLFVRLLSIVLFGARCIALVCVCTRGVDEQQNTATQLLYSQHLENTLENVIFLYKNACRTFKFFFL